MGCLYIARHGETEWNALRRLQGATDIPLNDVGRDQARALGESLRGLGIVSVTTSDLSRARETGEIAASVLGVSMTAFDPELRERSFGVFEGLNREELESRFPEEWRQWQESGIVPKGGEPSELVVARMKRALERVIARGGSTLVVSHGAATRLALSELAGRALHPIANGAVHRVDMNDGVTIVRASEEW
jgi:uncharacterized phosphatase